ncbi:hypothetical protein [Actinacidiphila glaucinigra]|uniref:Uncharacterized protein n=1 Tax=Actinacidiphila glaucinigra TaxID=235986 RepID=A0A239B954_9ACTN|nr:hypothetical protein [Actinacidiphila glaucinigra]SNS04477.1 hypothetical protein SAMN05216252_102475 [Actinacidiphila glaucinigra]
MTGEVVQGSAGGLSLARVELAARLRWLRIECMDMSMAALARHLAARGYGSVKDRSGISRYEKGERVPDDDFVTLLYEAATEKAGRSLVFGKSDLLTLCARARRRACSSCATSGRAVKAMRHAMRQLRRENQRLRAESESLHSSVRAGLAEESANRRGAASLPVPHGDGDRQRWARDVVAARSLVESVQRLHARRDQVAVVTVMRRTGEVLTPAESATALVLLRELSEDQLADNLLHIYGREQPERDVMEAALALHERGYERDAGALLKAATR